jgi:hypothetical protein
MQHKAYVGKDEDPPDDENWTELNTGDYAKLWYSDDDRVEIVASEDGEYAALLSRLKVDSREKTTTSIAASFEGYGTAPSGNGVAIKVWNHENEAWENTELGGDDGVDDEVALTLVSDLPDYVDDDGFVWFLAETTHASNGTTPATLRCDYVSLTVTVNGITYCDILSYRDVDRVDVKPFVYRTELSVKSWFFENTGE